MNKETLTLLSNYIKADIDSFYIKEIDYDFFENSIVINSDSELNGHYEGITFCPPNWFKKVEELSKIGNAILIIDLNNCKDQKKFIEIIKYKQVSTFELPKNCIIIVTCKQEIDEEIGALLVWI